jgi:C-terminal processing protease CtpA/Prc
MKKIAVQITLAALALVLFFQLAGTKNDRHNKVQQEDYKYLSLFSEVSAYIKTGYVEEIDPAEKFPGAYTAMMRALDRCSAYLDEEQSLMYKLYKSGTAYSAGIFGQRIMNYFYISDVVKDSPAAEAGLARGDVIKAVNGKSLFALSYWEMYLALLSKAPETKELIVFKENSDKPEKISLETGKPKTGLNAKPLDSGALYIQLPSIDGPSVSFLKRSLANGPSRLIIDLRRYSGGDFKSFLSACRLLFGTGAKGTLTLKAKEKQEEVVFASSKERSYKVAAIIGSSTIMYNELLAGLLKENGAQLVGNPTPGMAARQKEISLDDGSSLLITDAQFFLNGKNICDTGVLPHEELEKMEDQQLIAACNRLLHKQ